MVKSNLTEVVLCWSPWLRQLQEHTSLHSYNVIGFQKEVSIVTDERMAVSRMRALMKFDSGPVPVNSDIQFSKRKVRAVAVLEGDKEGENCDTLERGQGRRRAQGK